MSTPSLAKLYEVTQATWPAAKSFAVHGCIIRDGQGGGKRASAATLEADLNGADIDLAEKEMRTLRQRPLFMVRDGEEDLDKDLAARGYGRVDPVNLYLAEASALSRDDIPRTIAIPASEPLQIMKEIWARGGIGPDRLSVMDRACTPKSGIISRYNDKPAGACFMAMHDAVTMVHALEILPQMRRQGIGRWAMHRAAQWTLSQGGKWVAVACTQDNDAANFLYLNLGMRLMGAYHYRLQPE